MYCIYCGTYLEEDMSICPYCRESLREALNDIDACNKEELKQLCPDVNTEIEIEILGRKKLFNLQYSRVINTYKFFEKLLYRNKMEFVEKMIRIQDFDTRYAEKLLSLAMNDLKKTALLAEAFFDMEGIQIGYDKICAKYEDILRQQFAGIANIVEKIRNDKSKWDSKLSDEYKKTMEGNYKTRWVGGGFGITGAIKGSIQASLLNAGASVLTGTASTVGYISSVVISNSEDRRMKSELFNSETFRMYVAERYSYAMQKILIWNCKKIDKELTTGLFEGEFNKRVKAEIREWTKTMPKEELIQKFFDVLLLNPYYSDLYISFYKNLEEVTSKDILKVVSNIGNEINIKYLLMQEDVDLIKESTSYLDDSRQVSMRKFRDLQKLSERNLGYCDYELASSEIACMYKDQYVRNWYQAIGIDVRNMIGYCNYKDALPVRWDYVDNNVAYAYTVYSIYLINAQDSKYNEFSERQLLEENEGLLRNIKSGNKAAICIWAALSTRYSIIHRKDVLKYADVVWRLANQGNALAMSLVGEWFDQGIADFPENKYIAEMYFRMAMLQGNPYAIAYIGYYYKNGWAGFPKDMNLANDLFDITIEVPFSRSNREK